MRVFDGPMAFVPEGQADRSLARSAWVNATPRSRPVGYGLIRARVRCRFDDWSDEISNTKTENIYVVYGISCARSCRTLRDGSFEGRFPRHFVPGYYLMSLRDKIHSIAEALLKSASIVCLSFLISKTALKLSRSGCLRAF
jgi:hypothetical protein